MIDKNIKKKVRYIPIFIPFYCLNNTKEQFYILLYIILIFLFIFLCSLIWIGYFDKD